MKHAYMTRLNETPDLWWHGIISLACPIGRVPPSNLTRISTEKFHGVTGSVGQPSRLAHPTNFNLNQYFSKRTSWTFPPIYSYSNSDEKWSNFAHRNSPLRLASVSHDRCTNLMTSNQSWCFSIVQMWLILHFPFSPNERLNGGCRSNMWRPTSRDLQCRQYVWQIRIVIYWS